MMLAKNFVISIFQDKVPQQTKILIEGEINNIEKDGLK